MDHSDQWLCVNILHLVLPRGRFPQEFVHFWYAVWQFWVCTNIVANYRGQIMRNEILIWQGGGIFPVVSQLGFIGDTNMKPGNNLQELMCWSKGTGPTGKQKVSLKFPTGPHALRSGDLFYTFQQPAKQPHEIYYCTPVWQCFTFCKAEVGKLFQLQARMTLLRSEVSRQEVARTWVLGLGCHFFLFPQQHGERGHSQRPALPNATKASPCLHCVIFSLKPKKLAYPCCKGFKIRAQRNKGAFSWSDFKLLKSWGYQ